MTAQESRDYSEFWDRNGDELAGQYIRTAAASPRTAAAILAKLEISATLALRYNARSMGVAS